MSESNRTTVPTSDTADDREHAHRYTGALASQIEQRWQRHWSENAAYRVPNPGDADFDATRPKFYCLDMFPYPSGAGLHVGHPLGYIATDVVSRHRRMRGFNVLHPMGWDAFGLPAEQYAVQNNVHPALTTRRAIDTFRSQLSRLGLGYDWSREIETIDPEYYRWTQWIWLKAYHAWYDPDEGRARPIEELIDELANGRALIGPSGEIVRPGVRGQVTAVVGESAGLRRWFELEPDERREILDGQRLAYLGEQTVNWCAKLGTVLANEEVIDGRSERGGHPVLRVPMRQWMFRITAYADRLLRDLQTIDWPESTRSMQVEWIGRSEGAEIDFALPTGIALPFLRVYTTRPDTIFGATYMVIAPEHPLVDTLLEEPPAGVDTESLRAYRAQAAQRADVDRLAESREKTGVPTGISATNPATGESIPVWVADYVLGGYGHGAIMAVPAHDQRDLEFARRFGLSVRRVVRAVDQPDSAPVTERAEEAEGVATNSTSGALTLGGTLTLDGLTTAEAKRATIEWLESSGIGRRKVNYRLRDWLFSRQRYWGEPFPIVYDHDGNHWPVMESALPVRLPELEDFRPVESDTPMPPLGRATEWVETTAGAAGVDPALLPPETPVRRETNTMPNWAGSCWYYLRYCDPRNSERLVGREAERYWMTSSRSDGQPHVGGIDLYVGGAEHAVLHLLYARFWHKMLFDLGETSTPEPVGRLFHQGMITAFAYQRADRSLVPADAVDELPGGTHVERDGGAPVTQVIAKMSKSLRNVINPDEVIAEYGADTFRLYEMYMGPLEASKPWNPRDIVGPYRFLQRLWRLVIDERTGELRLAEARDGDIERLLHRMIQRVDSDLERLSINTAIAATIEFVNAATTLAAGTDGRILVRDQVERLALALAPCAPHLCEELWHRLGHAEPIVAAAWPEVDPSMLVDDHVEMPVAFNGKVRHRLTVPTDGDAATLEAAALTDPKVRELLEGRTPRKVIVVPGKMINIVV